MKLLISLVIISWQATAQKFYFAPLISGKFVFTNTLAGRFSDKVHNPSAKFDYDNTFAHYDSRSLYLGLNLGYSFPDGKHFLEAGYSQDGVGAGYKVLSSPYSPEFDTYGSALIVNKGSIGYDRYSLKIGRKLNSTFSISGGLAFGNIRSGKTGQHASSSAGYSNGVDSMDVSSWEYVTRAGKLFITGGISARLKINGAYIFTFSTFGSIGLGHVPFYKQSVLVSVSDSQSGKYKTYGFSGNAYGGGIYFQLSREIYFRTFAEKFKKAKSRLFD